MIGWAMASSTNPRCTNIPYDRQQHCNCNRNVFILAFMATWCQWPYSSHGRWCSWTVWMVHVMCTWSGHGSSMAWKPYMIACVCKFYLYVTCFLLPQCFVRKHQKLYAKWRNAYGACVAGGLHGDKLNKLLTNVTGTTWYRGPKQTQPHRNATWTQQHGEIT